MPGSLLLVENDAQPINHQFEVYPASADAVVVLYIAALVHRRLATY
jgi:hypothetical protein